MKIKSLLISALMILFVHGIILNISYAQQNSTYKNKLLSLYRLYTKFIESDEHYEMLSDQKTYGEKMQEKVKHFFKISGFENEQEVTKVDEKYKDDTEIIEARKKFEEASQRIYTKYINEHPELLERGEYDDDE